MWLQTVKQKDKLTGDLNIKFDLKEIGFLMWTGLLRLRTGGAYFANVAMYVGIFVFIKCLKFSVLSVCINTAVCKVPHEWEGGIWRAAYLIYNTTLIKVVGTASVSY
jgi:hypothetical protein